MVLGTWLAHAMEAIHAARLPAAAARAARWQALEVDAARWPGGNGLGGGWSWRGMVLDQEHNMDGMVVIYAAAPSSEGYASEASSLEGRRHCGRPGGEV